MRASSQRAAHKAVTLRYVGNLITGFGRRALARGLTGLAAGAMLLRAAPAAADDASPGPTEVAGAIATRDGDQGEAQVVSLVNALRIEHGLAPLERDATLSELARERSADMARRGYFSHDIPG